MCKSDRELLELAAKAAGYSLCWTHGGDLCWLNRAWDVQANNDEPWNPFTDDGDALRLAGKLCMTICTDGDLFVSAGFLFTHGPLVTQRIEDAGDKEAATRRAIVRAAAAIGEAMK